jgi:hypothetical protein
MDKQFSKVITAHAVSKLANQSKNQKEIAKLLGIDEANITRAKQGTHHFSPSQLDTLIKEYGSPKIAYGKYVQAGLIETIDDFIAGYEKRHLDVLIGILIDTLKHPKFQSCLANWFVSTEVRKDYKDHWDDEDKYESNFYNWMLTVLQKPPFKEWFLKIHDEVTKEEGFSYAINRYWDDFIEILNPTIYDCGQFPQDVFYFIGFLSERFNIADLATTRKPDILNTSNEIVLTGTVIDEYKSNVTNASFDLYRSLKKTLQSMENTMVSQHPFSETNLNDDFEKIIVQDTSIDLYLNDCMEYRILITEFNINEQVLNRFVVNNIPCDKVFLEYTKLKKHFNESITDIDSLKEVIAANGGYIAGALVL